MLQESAVPTTLRLVFNKARFAVDRLVTHPRRRWLFFFGVFLAFAARMVLLDGYYAAMYLFAFYAVQNVIQYLTPNNLPTIQEEEEMGQVVYDIPETVQVTRNEDASKPIIRKLGEFKLWKKLTAAALICLGASFVPALDIPVFWPILLFYFVFVVISVVARQYQHMKRYGYSMGDFFKKGQRGQG